MTYAIPYDFDMLSKISSQDSILQNFNRLQLEPPREQPVLYVTMATWTPKCNVYRHIIDPDNVATTAEEPQKVQLADTSQTKNIENISESENQDTGECNEVLCETVLEETEQESILIESDSETEDNSEKVTPEKIQGDDKVKPPSAKRKTQTTIINFYKNTNKSTPSSKDIEKNTNSNPTVKIKDDKNVVTPTSKIQNEKDVATPSDTPASKTEKVTDIKTSTNSALAPSTPGNTASTNESKVTPKRQLKSSRRSKGNSDKSEPRCTRSTEKENQTSSRDDELILLSEESENSKEITSLSIPTTPLSKDKGESNGETTPLRLLTPKQQQRKIESEKKRLQKEKEREEREKQKNEEKEKKEAEKLKKREQKQKEIELKIKEKEEKEEMKKREKEEKLKKQQEKEEEKLKRQQEREEEKLKKQQELDEKNKEKLKEDEKKQKAAAAFVSFFVPKKIEEEKKVAEHTLAFMPFEVKSDMKLPPSRREPLTEKEKVYLSKLLEKNDPKFSYLMELKSMKPRTCRRTWPYQEIDDDVTIIDEDEIVGEKICEEKPEPSRMRAKFLKFQENQRPAYYGTWRKKSTAITGRRPFAQEKIFDYEVDSDDDWEEEEQGENLEVGSDDDKENETENEDYEVDNEFFVPHGHLSDDEVDDEENSKLSPESLKQKLKLLKDAFDQDMQSKTQKIKPRSIGCIWYNKNGDNVDETIDRHLKPLKIITNGQIDIQKRQSGGEVTKRNKNLPFKDIPENLMPVLIKLVHGSSEKRRALAEKFLNYIELNNAGLEISKAQVQKHISNLAQWSKNSEVKRKLCWMVNEDAAEKYNVELVLPSF